jgi:thiamine pyrophosphokinase
MDMVALIVTGGDCPPPEIISALAKEAVLVIAADSGLDVCLSADIEPDIVVGDFDSIRRESLASVSEDKILRYPEEKDYTDTELAVEAAIHRGAQRIVLAGGGAGRLDHLLAVRALFERETPIHEWHTAKECVFLVPAQCSLHFSASSSLVVSVFPLSKGARGMRSQGLKWPLDGLVWDCGHFGVSNRTVTPQVEISSGQEPILVILPLGIRATILEN